MKNFKKFLQNRRACNFSDNLDAIRLFEQAKGRIGGSRRLDEADISDMVNSGKLDVDIVQIEKGEQLLSLLESNKYQGYKIKILVFGEEFWGNQGKKCVNSTDTFNVVNSEGAHDWHININLTDTFDFFHNCGTSGWLYYNAVIAKAYDDFNVQFDPDEWCIEEDVPDDDYDIFQDHKNHIDDNVGLAGISVTDVDGHVYDNVVITAICVNKCGEGFGGCHGECDENILLEINKKSAFNGLKPETFAAVLLRTYYLAATSQEHDSNAVDIFKYIKQKENLSDDAARSKCLNAMAFAYKYFDDSVNDAGNLEEISDTYMVGYETAIQNYIEGQQGGETDPVPFNAQQGGQPGVQQQNNQPAQPAQPDAAKPAQNSTLPPVSVLVPNPAMTAQKLQEKVGTSLLVFAGKDFFKNKPGAFKPLEKSLFCQKRPGISHVIADFSKSVAKIVKNIQWIVFDPVNNAYYCKRQFKLMGDTSDVIYRVVDFISWQDLLDLVLRKTAGGGLYYETVNKAETKSYSQSPNGFDVLADSNDFFKKHKGVDVNAQFPYTIGVKVVGKQIATPAAGSQNGDTYGVKFKPTPELTKIPELGGHDDTDLLQLAKSLKLRFVDVKLWRDNLARPDMLPKQGSVVEIAFPGVDTETAFVGQEAMEFLDAYDIREAGEKIVKAAMEKTGGDVQLAVTFHNKNINI